METVVYSAWKPVVFSVWNLVLYSVENLHRLFPGFFRICFVLRISGGAPEGYHVAQIDVVVHVIAGIRDIMLQDREEDQGSNAGCEAAVIEHQTSVQGACCSTECSTEHARNDACDRAVTSDDGTETGGKGDAVDISLRRHGP